MEEEEEQGLETQLFEWIALAVVQLGTICMHSDFLCAVHTDFLCSANIHCTLYNEHAAKCKLHTLHSEASTGMGVLHSVANSVHSVHQGAKDCACHRKTLPCHGSHTPPLS